MAVDGISAEIYLSEVSGAPVLTRNQELELFERLRQGDESAREQIIRSNLRFVVKIANTFNQHGVPIADLIQEGNIGLMEVIDKFDHRRGFRFSTYAAFWIRQAIQVAVRKQCGITRLPIRKSRMLGYISEAIFDFSKTEGREPTHRELAERLAIGREQLEELMQLRKSWCSLDEEQNEDHATLLDLLPAENQRSPREICAERQARRQVASWLRDNLNDREQKIISLRFGFANGNSHSLRSTSKYVGLSQEGVRRIEKKALGKLRRPALLHVA